MKQYLLVRTALVVAGIWVSTVCFSQKNAGAKVSILDFKLEKTHGKVNIHWATNKTDEVNYFEVERSSDGKNFKTVALVLGPDPMVSEGDCYGCFDKLQPGAKQRYYRLKHVDVNGGVAFSEVKMIALK